MSVQQISVFVESKPGHLVRVLQAVEQAKVSVRGYSASDTGDYGIVRFVVDNPTRALEVLKELGCAAKITDVLCLKLEDTPGELARVIDILSSCNINVQYSYSLVSTYIAMYVEDIQQAEELLRQQPVELVSQNDLA